MIFLTGTAEELRSLRAKHRPRRHDQVQYKPAVGRDTNSGPLVAAKEYLITLEQHTQGLASHLEQSSRRKTAMEKTGHWFRAISESEPAETYLKRAASDLARSCEVMEGHHGDTDEILFIQNLQSIADYVRAAQDLLTRVEDAVDKFLYWDEEVNIIEAVTSSPLTEQSPPLENSEDVVFDDSGVSDITSSSNNSGNSRPNHVTDHVTAHESASLSGVSNSEKWAQANEKCADAKDYLEMMCRDLSDELSQFDLHKEKELKQVLLDYAAAQLERHEKFQGKWFAMRYLLDTPILPEKRAIQFSNGPTDATAATNAKQQLTSSIEGQ